MELTFYFNTYEQLWVEEISVWMALFVLSQVTSSDPGRSLLQTQSPPIWTLQNQNQNHLYCHVSLHIQGIFFGILVHNTSPILFFVYRGSCHTCSQVCSISPSTDWSCPCRLIYCIDETEGAVTCTNVCTVCRQDARRLEPGSGGKHWYLSGSLGAAEAANAP